MKRIFLVLVLLSVGAHAQDRVKLSASGLVTETRDMGEAKYLKGYSVDGDVKLLGGESGWRLGALASYQKVYGVEIVPESMLYMHGLYRNTHTFAFGAQLSKRLGAIEPFGAFLIGRRRPSGDLDKTTFKYETVRQYRVGVDILKGHFFLRPLYAEFEATGGLGANRTHKFGSGAGMRF